MSRLIDWVRSTLRGNEPSLPVSEVRSVDEFVRWVFETPPANDEMAFYRGHSKADTYKLVPYALRSPEDSEAEPRKYRELLMANPVDFRDDANTFERLSRMQH